MECFTFLNGDGDRLARTSLMSLPNQSPKSLQVLIESIDFQAVCVTMNNKIEGPAVDAVSSFLEIVLDHYGLGCTTVLCNDHCSYPSSRDQ